jgi:hypothetical protein
LVRGRLSAPSSHGAPEADARARAELAAFSAELAAVHRRYAEVVARFRLCPHLRDVDAALGAFVVVLSTELELDEVVTIAREVASTGVAHLVFPLLSGPSSDFERFGNKLGEALRVAMGRRAPVLAVFHPEMRGDPGGAYKAIGLYRQSPDPLLQLVPEGLTTGGTVLVSELDAETLATESHAEATFARLCEHGMSALLGELASVREARARLTPPSWLTTSP